MDIKIYYFWFTLPANPGKFYHARALNFEQVLGFLRDNYSVRLEGHKIGMESELTYINSKKSGCVTFDLASYDYEKYSKIKPRTNDWVEGTVQEFLELTGEQMAEVEKGVSDRKRHRRTKAEMEAARAKEFAASDEEPVKQKRHRRTKAEMEAYRTSIGQ